jgi:hypothetical protein
MVIMPKWPVIVQAATIIARRAPPLHVVNAMSLLLSITMRAFRGDQVLGSKAHIIDSVSVVTRKWRAVRWGAPIVMKRRAPNRDQNHSSFANPFNGFHHVPYVTRYSFEQREKAIFQYKLLSLEEKKRVRCDNNALIFHSSSLYWGFKIGEQLCTHTVLMPWTLAEYYDILSPGDIRCRIGN